MSAEFVHPKRGWRHEAVPLAFVIATGVAMVLMFPHGAVGFSGGEIAAAPASCAFVTLTPDEESIALNRARAAWQSADSATRTPAAELAVDCLPEDSTGVVIADPPIPARDVRTERFALRLLPPTMAAGRPETIVRDADAADGTAKGGKAFSREDLLTID